MPASCSVCLQSPLGSLTVVAAGDQIIALRWGRTDAACAATPLLEDARAQLAAYFAGSLRSFSLAMCPTGTPFLRRAWAAIAAIPYGRTATYGELAARLGTAPRSVGLACRRNPLPILIPCHRVLAADGRLGGYSGGDGLATKRALLWLEGVPLPPPLAGID